MKRTGFWSPSRPDTGLASPYRRSPATIYSEVVRWFENSITENAKEVKRQQRWKNES